MADQADIFEFDHFQDFLQNYNDGDDQNQAGEKAPPPPDVPPEWDFIIEDIRRDFCTPKGGVSELDARLDSRLKDDEKYSEALKWTSPDGAGFLHYLLRHKDAAECCPPKVITSILNHNPASIERTVDGNVHPLTQAILNSYYHQKSSLANVMVARLHRGNPHRQLKDEKGEGRRCLEAAFEAMSGKNPIPLFTVLTLVSWATEPMLKGIVTKENLSPLHQAVMFDRGYTQPTHQPNLVTCLLERYEDGIYDLVQPGTYKTATGEIVLTDKITVYEWHQRTADLFASTRAPLERVTQAAKSVTSQKVPEWQGQGQNQQDRVALGRSIAGNKFKRQNSIPLSANGNTLNGGKEAEAGQETAAQNYQGGFKTKKVNDKEEQPTGEDKADAQELGREKQEQNQTVDRCIETKETEKRDKMKAAEEASRLVKLELQKSYLRATILTPKGGDTGETAELDETEIKQFFGREMQDVEIGLHLGEQPRGEPIKESDVIQFFSNRTFNSILAYVSLPQVPVTLIPPKSKFSRPRYHDDRLFYFHWLHETKKVNKILKIIVDDTQNPHRDEVIEEALGGVDDKEGYLNHFFDVEILKWRKIDLDPGTILRAAPNVKELHLEWSGSNVVLRGWSAMDGLPQLSWLRQVHLIYVQGNESASRIAQNIKEFSNRLKRCRKEQNEQLRAAKQAMAKAMAAQTSNARRPDHQQSQSQKHNQTRPAAGRPTEYPEIEVIEHLKTESGVDVAPLSLLGRSSGPKHKWLKYMRDFVSFIPDLPADMKDLNLSPMTLEKVTVALIDDGVDVFTSGMASFRDHILAGVSFDRSNDRHSSREWSSRGGHGTLMAKLILAVCPHANIIPYRVLMRPDKDTGTLRPDPESAAKAIIDAVNRGVDIISMSWSVTGDPKSMNEADRRGFERLKGVMGEVVGPSKGAKRAPLLFCAAADDGIDSDQDKYELPSKMQYTDIFRIGAATNALQTWVKVTKPSERDFFFPGVGVPGLRGDFQYSYDSLDADPYSNSGSSIACALAAGQAALILHCVKLSIYYTKKKEKEGTKAREEITEDDLKSMKQFEWMRNAFEIVCTENISQHKVSYPAQRFERASDQLRKLEDSGRLVSPERFEPVASLVRNMIGWRA